MYATDQLFRSHVIMARHGFGRGAYKSFAYPLPDVIAGLRARPSIRGSPASRSHAPEH